MEWAKNWVTDKLAGYAATGIQAGGNLAGNAVGGVGTLIENSGRSVGQSANGAVSGVGNYINGYGDSVRNSMAADGPVSAGGAGAKKTAVQPSTAVKRTANGTTKAASSAIGGVKENVPSTSKALPAAKPPSKPPTATNRVLPTKKPVPPTATTRTSPAQTAPNRSSAPGAKTAPRPAISTAQSERTPDGKVKISPVSRPQPVKAAPANSGPVRAPAPTASSRPAPVRAPISTGQGARTSDGKIKISPESRPRPVKV
ncbi:hypothetical protein CB0940_10458 [Cercospora beticola]|uniref:Uncharacterized protein n=1 Tax=Cercospora beticola TaxID=122368 RepID=A0A2G5HUG1_CERBT|nr:hypothetical protein CB0940_10458 [Cercospora beticola]PIA95913.1 hypothetical protein CB0940_10458 [Cercospora beticola]WPB07176.1 hypothetical protein RHO25_011836 [Cercospora beticola]